MKILLDRTKGSLSEGAGTAKGGGWGILSAENSPLVGIPPATGPCPAALPPLTMGAFFLTLWPLLVLHQDDFIFLFLLMAWTV